MNPTELGKKLRISADRLELNGGGVPVDYLKEILRQAADLLATMEPAWYVRHPANPLADGCTKDIAEMRKWALEGTTLIYLHYETPWVAEEGAP